MYLPEPRLYNVMSWTAREPKFADPCNSESSLITSCKLFKILNHKIICLHKFQKVIATVSLLLHFHFILWRCLGSKRLICMTEYFIH